jgi:hypothetical protein
MGHILQWRALLFMKYIGTVEGCKLNKGGWNS